MQKFNKQGFILNLSILIPLLLVIIIIQRQIIPTGISPLDLV